MRKNGILILLTLLVLAVSAPIWWTLILEPTLGLSYWIPLLVVALSCGLATVLSGGRWLWFVLAASVATFAGGWEGFTFWPLEDGIAQSYALFAIAAATLAVAVLSVAAGLACRKIAVSSGRIRLAFWLGLAACTAFAPVALALRPMVVAHRDKLAAERFTALKVAVERTRAESGNPASVCDGQALKRHYSGPPIRDGNWEILAGHYIREDRYVFGIWVDCLHPVHYTIDVRPAAGREDGTRSFCTDETGAVGCDMRTDRLLGSACYACTP